MNCKNCNKELNNGERFCPFCGTAVNFEETVSSSNGIQTENLNKITPAENLPQDKKESKIKKSYVWSVLSSIITFIIRIATQTKHYSLENLLRNKKVLGLDPNVKPFITAIPIICAIISLLIIVNDKNADSQSKTKALIINGIFIALALLFIWFDLPYSIIDF